MVTTSHPMVFNTNMPGIPADAFDIGRPGPLGNPFKIGRHMTRDQACDHYQNWALAHPDVMALIKSLRGRDLVCPGNCKPLRCHGDWILKQANSK